MSVENPATEAPSLARIGHVNLSVCDLGRSLAFYRGHLRMSVTKLLDEAAFLSLGGYHHDLCLNTWRSKGGSAGPEGRDRPLSLRHRLRRPRRPAGRRPTGPFRRHPD
jgi:catechol-2,3-dioxygenase